MAEITPSNSARNRGKTMGGLTHFRLQMNTATSPSLVETEIRGGVGDALPEYLAIFQDVE